MIYARVLDLTLADDYFKAMERVEQRLELRPPSKEQECSKYEIVKVQPDAQLFGWIERLALPELCEGGASGDRRATQTSAFPIL